MLPLAARARAVRPALLMFCLLPLLWACPQGGREGSSPETSTRTELPWLVGTAEASHDPVATLCVGGGATFCGRQVDPSVEGAIADPLLTKATAITGANGETLILATTTNIGYFLAYKTEQGGANGIYDIRLRVAEATGVPSANVIVVSDHSHNGPDTIGLWGGVEEDYLRITADAVVGASVAAFDNRKPARLKVAAVNDNANPVPGVPPLESSYAVPPAYDLSRGGPSNQFRLLVAEDAAGQRLLTMVNYAPHATVWNGVATDRLTGDWAAWAPQIAERRYGGMGLAAVGSVGATDWNKFGDVNERKAEAFQRLETLMDAADAVLQPVRGDQLQVQTTFIREPILQPVLLLNYKPRLPTNQPGLPSEHFDVRIDRSVLPPFLLGSVFGTYISAVRIGDIFLSTFPGEPFGELEYVLRGEERVAGAQAWFLLGAANDFFGYMVHDFETYQQTLEGAAWLLGCPEREILEPLGVENRSCADHWTLMVSPTIGQHIVCTLQNAAASMGFATQHAEGSCSMLTALDGLAPPEELPAAVQRDPEALAAASLQQSADLPRLCRERGALPALCSALEAALAQRE